jgi:uncharacterized delta-60 repeat protein
MMCAMGPRPSLTIAFVLALLVAAPSAGAATYSPTFALHPQFTSAGVGADGSIMAILEEEGENTTTTHSTVSRYFADGRPDRSFKPARSSWANAEAATAVDAKGRILRSSRSPEGGIERLSPDGSVELAFASPGRDPSAGGKPGPEFQVEAILPLAAGRVAVAGLTFPRGIRLTDGSVGESTCCELGVAVYDESGALDPSFGTGGTLRLDEEAGVEGEGLVGLTSGADGSLLVAVDGKSWSWHGSVPVVGEGSRVVALGPRGVLDPSFATGGVFSSPDRIAAVAGTPDGGLLLAGTTWGRDLLGSPHALTGDVYLERLTPRGVPDPAFGEGQGRTTVDLGGIDGAHALLLRPDGSTLVGGGVTAASARCVVYEGQFCTETPALAAFTANGRPDPRFGEDGVLRLASLGWEFAEFARTVPVEPLGVLFLRELPDGGVLAGGATERGAFLAEVAGDGRLARGFGDGGIVTVAHPRRSSTELVSLSVGRDGGIVASGRTDAGAANWGGGVFSFRPDGSVDRGFGAGQGYATLPEPPGTSEPLGIPVELPAAVSVDPRGRALVLGGDFVSHSQTITRLDPDGRPDRRFGIDGIARLPRYASAKVGHRGARRRLNLLPRLVTALPGGGALVYARAGADHEMVGPALIRLTSRGRLDRSFGHGGVAVPTGLAGGSALVALPGGKILLGGWVRSPCGEVSAAPTAALMRLQPDGSPDSSFGHRGLTTVPSCAWGRSVASMAVGPDGGIVVAAGLWRRWVKSRPGWSALHEAPAIERFSARGRLDGGFGHRAIRTAPPQRIGAGAGPRAEVVTAWRGSYLVSERGSPEALVYGADGRFERRLVPARGRGAVRGTLGVVVVDGKPVAVATTKGKATLTVRPLASAAEP